MKTLTFATVFVTLGLLSASASAQGPRTPVEALQRLQGQRTQRVRKLSPTRVLLQMSGGEQTAPVVKKAPLLKTPSTKTLFSSKKKKTKGTRATAKSTTDWRQAARDLGAQRSTVAPQATASRIDMSGSWFGAIFTKLRNLVTELY